MRRLAGLDTAFLALDGPSSVGHLVLLVALDGDLDPEGLTTRVAEWVARQPGLRRSLVTTPGGVGRPWWDEVDPRLEQHLGETALGDAGPEALAAAGLALAQRPLPRDRPLWRLDLVRTPTRDRAVVALTVHHAAADGLTIRDLVLDLFDHPGTQPLADDASRRPLIPPALRRWTGVADLPLALGGVALPLAGELGATVAGAPAATASRVLGRDRTHRRDPLPGLVGAGRSLGLSDVPLSAARALRRSHDATVNDVILAAASGALRRLLVERGMPPRGALQAAVPVSRRSADVTRTDADQGNRIALARCMLPVHEPARENRLELVQESMRTARRRPLVGDALFDAATRLAVPALATPALRAATRLGAGRLPGRPFDLMVSNVPVPVGPRSLLGVRVVALYPVPLVAESIGLNITAHGHDEQLHYGVTSSPAIVPDAPRLAALVADEHAQLAALAGG